MHYLINELGCVPFLCIDACIAHNWRLSLQMHKYLNIA